LAALAAHAAPSWEIEDLLAKFGEGIQEGQSLTVPLFKPGKVRLVGDGVKAVKMTQVDRKPPAVVLEGVPFGGQAEASFQLDIAYEDGTAELLSYFVVPKDAPSNFRSRLPNN
jgi:hypothetical protein